MVGGIRGGSSSQDRAALSVKSNSTHVPERLIIWTIVRSAADKRYTRIQISSQNSKPIYKKNWTNRINRSAEGSEAGEILADGFSSGGLLQAKLSVTVARTVDLCVPQQAKFSSSSFVCVLRCLGYLVSGSFDSIMFLLAVVVVAWRFRASNGVEQHSGCQRGFSSWTMQGSLRRCSEHLIPVPVSPWCSVYIPISGCVLFWHRRLRLH